MENKSANPKTYFWTKAERHQASGPDIQRKRHNPPTPFCPTSFIIIRDYDERLPFSSAAIFFLNQRVGVDERKSPRSLQLNFP